MLDYIDIEYVDTGKSVTTGGTTYTIFGASSTSGISWSYGSSASGEDNFNCSSINYGEYVLGWVARFVNETSDSIQVRYSAALQAKINGTRMRRVTLFDTQATLTGGIELHATIPVNATRDIYDGATEYRIVLAVTDRTHNQLGTVHSYFTCTNIPTASPNINASYLRTGKGIAVDGSLYYNLYGEDFNPAEFVRPSSRNTFTAYNETSSFDLQGFQPGHEVGAAVMNITNSGATGGYVDIEFKILRKNQTTNEREDFMEPFEYVHTYIGANSSWAAYIYFGVDYDEIRTGYQTYLAEFTFSGDGDGTATHYFGITNLSIDTTMYTSGLVWVSGPNIYYVDGIFGSLGFKHCIAYNGNYNVYVGPEYAGAIWIDPNYPKTFTYVDEYGYIRRTHTGRDWYSGSEQVSTDYSGRAWVAAQSDYTDGYSYLCYVDPAGFLIRMGNGPVSGIE